MIYVNLSNPGALRGVKHHLSTLQQIILLIHVQSWSDGQIVQAQLLQLNICWLSSVGLGPVSGPEATAVPFSEQGFTESDAARGTPS